MFFKKTTAKALSKLMSHGYAMAVIKIPEMVTEEETYQEPMVMYIISKDAVPLGLVPIGKSDEIQLIKLTSGGIFVIRDANDADFDELRLTLERYGYTLKMSSEPQPKLASVTSIKKEDK